MLGEGQPRPGPPKSPSSFMFAGAHGAVGFVPPIEYARRQPPHQSGEREVRHSFDEKEEAVETARLK